MPKAQPIAVPFVALGLQHRALKAELLGAIDRVLEHGQFVLGPEVEDFERTFAGLCGTPFAIGMSDGTHALILSLRALGIGPGDEVITAPNSFLACAAAIALVGARPVFADVRDDLNIDPDRIADAVTPRTRALMPVHLTGRPAEMERIGAIAERHGLAVVEDAAQAVGARLNGRPVGSFGAAGCFSLHPLKNLAACGDAGVVTTTDRKMADALRAARNHGLRSRDDCGAWSYNARLDTVQAAILNVKLVHLERRTEVKRKIAARYREALRDVVRVPEERPGETAVYQTFVIRAERRDALQRHLAERGIESKVHYPTPLHLQEAAADLGYKRGDFPVAERLAGEILSLPIYPELTDTQQEAVVAGMRSFYTGRA
ncbi:MAG TPA: DegT/DnrJ/EryC1/StrS family aminotransferase [Methylomirabilota bacterium]|nr:DegT/DnrJ/EryC1/StrS family aminotransferase [Methylomirabilota bacterium]